MSKSLRQIVEDSTRGSFLLGMGNITSILISALSILIIARILGPELYGLYSISTVIPFLLILLIDLGIDQGLIKFSASFRAKGQEHRVIRLLIHALSLRIVLGLGTTITSFIFSYHLVRLILNRPDITPYTQFASILIVLQTTFTAVNSIFVGLDKSQYSAVMLNCQAAIKALTSSLLVIYGLAVYGALIGHVLGVSIAITVGIFIIYRAAKLNNNPNISNETFLANIELLIIYGFPLYVSGFIFELVHQYENILLAILTSNLDIGNYRAATNFFGLINSISMPISLTLLTAFSKLEYRNEEIRRFFDIATKYLSMIFFPLVTLTMLYSNEIIGILYGENYKTASLFLSLCSIEGYRFGLGFRVLTSLFNGLGYTKTTLKLNFLHCLLFSIIAPILVWTLKVPGIIIANLISGLAINLYELSVAKSKMGIKIKAKIGIRVYIISLLPVIPLMALREILTLNDLCQLILGACLYFPLYLVLAPLLKVINISEVEKMEKIVGMIKPLIIITKPFFYFEERILLKFP